ncbi:MAG: aminotransferase class V-fold PLP-dependent enzyme [Longimicrobiales bacterium]|nr:aminotransferase class V-fold PLP-dependent enzyme [Longimicrobiales bacterium]
MPHYLDFAATSALRPLPVIEAVRDYLASNGATPGRGSYGVAVEAGRRVFEARRAVLELLGLPGDASRLTFSPNATTSINHVLNRVLGPGDAVVVTDFDHNSVLRPAAWLERNAEVQVRHVHGHADGTLDFAALRNALPGARLLTINAVSNVLGTVLPVAELVEEAHAEEVLVLVDSAQAAGHLEIDYGEADFVAFTGHKGLLGPQGTGGLWVRPEIDIEPLIAGGTGGDSLNREMPRAFPDRLEAGTLNGPGLAGLAAGAKWVLERGVAPLHAETRRLKEILHEGLSRIPGLTVLSPLAPEGAPIVTVASAEIDAATLAGQLDRHHDVQVRAGLHCAPEVHRLLGTTATGALRFSLGWASTDEDVEVALRATREVLQSSALPLRSGA